MKTRPVNLAELARVDRVHSIFAPSSGSMWALCPGSLIANLISKRKAGYEAAEGTVAHWVASNWIRTETWWPGELVGTTRIVDGHSIEITDEMLEHVQEYVVRVMGQEGVHYNERRIDISYVTPIPNQGGTGDHAIVRLRVLKIIDFKYGMRRIQARWNIQLLLYAVGWFMDLDVLYDFETIEIEIVQPRIGNYDTWTCTRDQLIEFMGYIRERARLAWKVDAPRTPGADQCEYCSESGQCVAQTVWLDQLVDQAFDNLDLEVTSEQMTAKKFDLEVFGMPAMVMPDYTRLSTEDMAALLPYRDLIESFFTSMKGRATEIEQEAPGSIEGFKNVERRTKRKFVATKDQIFNAMDKFDVSPLDLLKTVLLSPNQAETLVKKMKMPKPTMQEAMQVLAGMIERPKGIPELVPETDPRPPYADDIDVDDAFTRDDDEI